MAVRGEKGNYTHQRSRSMTLCSQATAAIKKRLLEGTKRTKSRGWLHLINAMFHVSVQTKLRQREKMCVSWGVSRSMSEVKEVREGSDKRRKNLRLEAKQKVGQRLSGRMGGGFLCNAAVFGIVNEGWKHRKRELEDKRVKNPHKYMVHFTRGTKLKHTVKCIYLLQTQEHTGNAHAHSDN